MRLFLFVLLLLVGVLPPYAADRNRGEAIFVKADEMAALLKKKPLVLDVRVGGETKGTDEKPWGLKCRACTVVPAPFDLDMGFFEDRDESALRSVRPQQPILIVCLAGVRAEKAATELTTKGYRVYILEGGLTTLPRSLVYGAQPPPRVAEK